MKYIAAILFSLLTLHLSAQFETDSTQLNNLKEENYKNVSLQLNSNLFLRNNEYFNNLYSGITFIGANINPSLKLTFNQQISFSTGWYIRTYNSKDNLTINELWYRLHYRFNKNLQLLMGNILGYENHHLIEPVLSQDFAYLNPPEKGLQFLYNTPNYDADLWINWQKFILPGDDYKEEFLLGYSSKIKLLNDSHKIGLSIPSDFLAKHKGGQMDSQGIPMQTFFNWAVGIDLSYHLKKNSKFGFESYYVQFNDASDHNLLQYINGYGIYSNFYLKNRLLDAYIGFWRGEFYYSPVGEPLFQSLSTKYIAYNESFKQLILFKIQYKNRIIENAPLYLRFESYYDPDRGSFDFSYSLLINIAEKINLMKLPTYE